MDWQSGEFLPPSDGTWRVWRPPWGREKQGEASVQRAIWQWHPWDPVLVSAPDSGRFLPPICIASLAAKIHRRMLWQYRLLLALLLLLTGTAAGTYVATGDPIFQRATLAGILFFGFVYLQYTLVLRHVDVLCELAKFVTWLYLQRTHAVLVVIGLMVFIGGVQLALQEHLGGLVPLLMRYGLVFDTAQHQWWRYLVGPFFHSGIAHWLSNLVLAVMVAGIAVPIGRKKTLVVIFMAGIVLPCLLLAAMPYALRSDALLGISGGVFTMLGWIAGVAIRTREQFPRYFGVLMLAFALMTLIAAMLLYPRANDVVHGSGLLLGLLFGLSKIGARVE